MLSSHELAHAFGKPYELTCVHELLWQCIVLPPVLQRLRLPHSVCLLKRLQARTLAHQHCGSLITAWA
jgi:hypothetical protein